MSSETTFSLDAIAEGVRSHAMELLDFMQVGLDCEGERRRGDAAVRLATRHDGDDTFTLSVRCLAVSGLDLDWSGLHLWLKGQGGRPPVHARLDATGRAVFPHVGSDGCVLRAMREMQNARAAGEGAEPGARRTAEHSAGVAARALEAGDRSFADVRMELAADDRPRVATSSASTVFESPDGRVTATRFRTPTGNMRIDFEVRGELRPGAFFEFAILDPGEGIRAGFLEVALRKRRGIAQVWHGAWEGPLEVKEGDRVLFAPVEA